MNISYKWLKNYIDLDVTPTEVAEALTSIGLEVEGVEEVESIRGGLKGLVVAEVLTCVNHENSDHLHVCTVNVGEAEPLQIVCGAPNVAAGQKVICATIGTVLYDGDQSFTIKKGKMRGVESYGMLCAEDEIGVGSSHDGIIVLPADAVVGTPAAEYYHLESDSVIEVDITPNRADAVSHYGVARDLNAYFAARGKDAHLRRVSVDDVPVTEGTPAVAVEVQNSDACPRYSSLTIRGVKVQESPDWLKNALQTIGLRPINNVVDITNYVLMEVGQPLHAFDTKQIKGGKIIVRNAQEGEPFTTLDEVERKLSAADLVICNGEEPMCIAGVFGGLQSGVTMDTVDVTLESAYFNPVGIRKTARRHGLSTDASFRYERGCDPNNTIYALKRAAQLILELGGGQIDGGFVDVKNGDCYAPFEVKMDLKKAWKLMGKEIPQATIEAILKALEIDFSFADGIYDLKVPRYRVDVQRDCDVVEDILRIYGYNNVEFSDCLKSNLSYSTKPDTVELQKKISEQLTAQGFNEILNNSLTKVSYYENSELYPLDHSVHIMNPLSQDLGVMRQTLLYGGLESIARNVNRKNGNLKFYEFGNVYRLNRGLYNKMVSGEVNSAHINAYQEEYHLGLWLTGNKTSQSWVVAETPATFYQLRAYVNSILVRLGVNPDNCRYEEVENEVFSAALRVLSPSKKELGVIGILNRATRKAFDIDQEVFYADLLWDKLLGENKQYKLTATDLAKFPEVKRDLALLVDKNVAFADLRKAAFDTEKKLLKRVYLFDVYEGKNLPSGKKSYALSFILQDTEKTLQDRQIDAIMQRLQKTYEEKFNAQLR